MMGQDLSAQKLAGELKEHIETADVPFKSHEQHKSAVHTDRNVCLFKHSVDEAMAKCGQTPESTLLRTYP